MDIKEPSLEMSRATIVGDAQEHPLEASTYRKVFWRLIPIFFACYIVSYLDRVNIGFAKLQMLSSLNLDDDVYAMGASILFWGYVLFEIPSGVVLHRVGARKWIARIMITWGLVSASLMYVHPLADFFHTRVSTMFYILRFLLGVCEAGFGPGVFYLLNNWFPAKRQSRVFAAFMLSLPISLCIGNPLSGWILQNMHDVLGYQGWQWLLLLEAVPSVILGIVVFFSIPESIEKAKWLLEEERHFWQGALQREHSKKIHDFGAALKSRGMWTLALISLTMLTGFYGLSFWLPTIIQASGLKDAFHVGLLAAIPYAVSGVAMIANAIHSHKTQERRIHAAVPALVAGIALILSARFAGNLPLSMMLITVAAAGIMAIIPLFWSFAGQLLSGIAAAAGLALINSIGSLSGIAGAMITNVVKNMTGSVTDGTYVLGASLLACCILILTLPRELVSPVGDS
ncbi:MFS transporter [Paraburkholderia heleia]|uniref:MFS transporter n=1 Tax=Paraburkholderia heleia TaxID=634127 RepID=UPI0031CEF9A3